MISSAALKVSLKRLSVAQSASHTLTHTYTHMCMHASLKQCLCLMSLCIFYPLLNIQRKSGRLVSISL